MPTASAPSTLIRAVVDQQRLVRPQAEAVERETVDGGIGLQQLHLAGDDDVAEAGEEGRLLRARRAARNRRRNW